MSVPRRRVGMLLRNPFTHDTRVEKEAASLRDGGYEVTVVAHAGAGLPADEVRDGIRVVRVARRWPRVPLARYVGHELAMAAALVDVRPEIVHAHDSDALLAAWRAARRLGAPLVYDAHDLWLGRPRRGRSRAYFAANQLLYGAIERRILPRAAAHLTVSRPIAEHLARRYRLPPVQLVPNYPALDGLEPDRVLPLRELPGGSAIPDGAPIALYVGNLMAGRGLEQLVAAVARLATPAHLVLLGGGAQAAELERLAGRLGVADRVHRLGPVPSSEVIARAADATVGISPIVDSCLNYRYSLPNKLFQYMAAGLPVVASDFPQVREVVEASGAGRCVDTSDPAAIARAIDALAADPEAARRAGAAGRAAVRDRFHWGTAAATLLEVYARVSRL